jgi:cytochrome c
MRPSFPEPAEYGQLGVRCAFVEPGSRGSMGSKMMAMSKAAGIAGLISAFVFSAPGTTWAQQETATAEEVVQRVKEAAAYLARAGEPGLETFRSKDSPYVWKDSYVVVDSCELDQVVAHPIRPDDEGQPVSALTDSAGKIFGPELCERIKQPQGGWVEYMWPKPGGEEPTRKVTYALKVEDTPYLVDAGVYDDAATIEELERVSGGRQ